MNMLLPMLFNRDGELNTEVAKSIAPSFIKENPLEVSNFVFRLVSEMDLDDDFIIRNLDDLDLELVLQNNVLAEETLFTYRDKIVSVLFELMTNMPDGPDYRILEVIFNNDYSEKLFDALGHKVISQAYIGLNLDGMEFTPRQIDEIQDTVSLFLNVCVTKFSKEFVLNPPLLNLFNSLYMLNAAIQREDITLDDLSKRLNRIGMEEITSFIDQLADIDDNGVIADLDRKKKMIYEVSKMKLTEVLETM